MKAVVGSYVSPSTGRGPGRASATAPTACISPTAPSKHWGYGAIPTWPQPSWSLPSRPRNGKSPNGDLNTATSGLRPTSAPAWACGHTGWTIRWIRAFLYYDQLNYGDSSVLYQKHGYRVGRYKDLYDNHRNFGKIRIQRPVPESLQSLASSGPSVWTVSCPAPSTCPAVKCSIWGACTACGLYGKPDRRGWRLLRQRRIQCTPG